MLDKSYIDATHQPALTYEEFKRLFIDDVTDPKQYGLDVHALLCKWEETPVNAPSMRQIMEMAGKALGINENARHFNAALAAGDLGHEEGRNWPDHKKEFHAAPDHPRKVLLQTIRIISTFNSLVARGEMEGPALSHEEISMLMAVAATHDLGHDGIGNVKEDIHSQFRLEKIAFISFQMHFGSDFGIDSDKIKTVFLCTDPSSKDGPLASSSPMMIMRDFYKGAIKLKDLPEELIGLKDKRTLLYSKIINIADLATSAGISENRTRRESWYLSQETGDPNIAKDSSSKWFIKTAGITEDFLPAKKAYGDNPTHIVKKLKADNQINLNFSIS